MLSYMSCRSMYVFMRARDETGLRELRYVRQVERRVCGLM